MLQTAISESWLAYKTVKHSTEHFVKPDEAKHLEYLNRMEEADMARPDQDKELVSNNYHQHQYVIKSIIFQILQIMSQQKYKFSKQRKVLPVIARLHKFIVPIKAFVFL